MTQEPGGSGVGERVRQAVRDSLAESQRDPAWLARAAEVDYGTVSDFLAGNRWPRFSTLAKIEAALGWAPGTIDRLTRGAEPPTTTPPTGLAIGAFDVDATEAMLRAIEHEMSSATDAWTSATMRLREAETAARAAEDHRAQLALEHARLARRLDDLRAPKEGGPDARPTR